MIQLSKLSLRKQLVLGMAVTSTAAMVFTLIAFSVQDLSDTHRHRAEHFHSMVSAISLNAGQEIFTDGDAARSVAAGFGADPSVSRVLITNSDGAVLGTYPTAARTDSLPFDLTSTERIDRFKGALLFVYHPVVRDGRLTGAIIVEANSDFGNRLLHFILEGLAASVVALLLLVLPLAYVIGKLVVAPAKRLSGLARSISTQRDYTVRAQTSNTGEFGDLERAFNEMLSTIEEQQSELKAARAEELKKGAGFWELVFDRFPAQIAVYDTDLRYLYVNPASMSDPKKRQALIGTTSFEYWKNHAANRDAGKRRHEAAQRCLDTGAITSVEETLVTKTGETRHYVRMFNPVRSPDGDISMIIGYGFDITDRKNAEQLTRDNEERERRSAQLEAIGRLAGGIAHDFNNLLTVITGYASVLKDELNEGDVGYEALDNIANATQRAASLTGQLLAYGRKQVLQPRVLDVRDSLLKAENDLRDLLGRDIELSITTEHSWSVFADPEQLQQVMINLALNARDAMPDGGALEVVTSDTKLTSHTDSVLLGETDPGEYVCLSFRDTGAGMDEETASRVFEPFFTTKRLGGGAGLGLATVYGIVSQSGGAINLISTPGMGTTIEVFLPVANASAESAEPASPSGDSSRAGSLILLVEDEAMVRDFTHKLLTKWGYEVLEASTPARAVELVRATSRPIDLLLTDVIMPGMTGVEMAEELKQIQPGFRVVFMSGYAEPIIDGGAKRAGGTFIQKPFRPSELADIIRDALERSVSR